MRWLAALVSASSKRADQNSAVRHRGLPKRLPRNTFTMWALPRDSRILQCIVSIFDQPLRVFKARVIYGSVRVIRRRFSSMLRAFFTLDEIPDVPQGTTVNCWPLMPQSVLCGFARPPVL